jgi:hypothetical protein
MVGHVGIIGQFDRWRNIAITLIDWEIGGLKKVVGEKSPF